MDIRTKLSPKAKTLFMEYCESKEIHSILQVTYKDVAERVVSWMYSQPSEVWNEIIKVLETEILASEGKCFTGRISRLVSCLDGFHPDIRVSIASSDQISNRVLAVISKAKTENLSRDKTESLVKQELMELELEGDQLKDWLSNAMEMIED